MSMKRILTNYELSTRLMGRLSHVVSGNSEISRGGGKLPSLLFSHMYLVIEYLVTISAMEDTSWRESLLAPRETSWSWYPKTDRHVRLTMLVSSLTRFAVMSARCQQTCCRHVSLKCLSCCFDIFPDTKNVTYSAKIIGHWTNLCVNWQFLRY
jgi:hypothetical protein